MSEQQVARTAGAAALRGALLVGAAVLIGVLLLSKNDGILASAEEGERSIDVGSTDDVAVEVETETSVPAPATTPVAAVTTTTVIAEALNVRDPANVKITVSNGAFVDGSRVGGAAGKTRDRLVPLGYNVIGVSNWEERQARTAVYYVAGGGYQNDARSIARELGIEQPQVLVSPGPAVTAELANANVLVVLGADTEG